MKSFRYWLVLLMLIMPAGMYARTCMYVKSQEDFDALQSRIEQKIKDGEKSIYVYFSKGEYEASENQIKLVRLKAPNADIHIIGKKGATIVPKGAVYRNGDEYYGSFSVKSSWMNGQKDLNIWSHVKYADGIVELVDEAKKQCRLKTTDELPWGEFDNAYILIPAWYQSYIYKIDKIEKGYIYFTADDLKKSYRKGYNVNNDYNYAGSRIRYKLCNIEDGENHIKVINGKVKLPNGVSEAREGRVHNVIYVKECKLNALEIKGLSFRGNEYGKYSALVRFENNNCNRIDIKECSFYGIKSNVVEIISSSNVSICENSFSECYNSGITADNKSANVTLNSNRFNAMGRLMLASSCISCSGENYQVTNNIMTDFGYCGVSVGICYGTKQEEPSCGVVENNRMYYTDSYIADIDNNAIMDGGAIYVGTKNTEAIIRNNVIQNYTGLKDNRGIFCDDGTFGVQIYGNYIMGIQNSYSIDCRRVKSVEQSQYPQSGIERANINNVIRDNIVNAPIRFEGHEDADNGCYKGSNVYLNNNENALVQTKYNHVKTDAEDVMIENGRATEQKVEVSKTDYDVLRRSANWNQIKRFVKRK